jgi:pimeloyl-ACP methyl ester carboxylesterase
MEYFVTCNGIPVHVSETGSGDNAVVLLHGYLETLYIWEDFRTFFPESSHIISIDLPGLGLTGSAPEVNSMEFDAKVLLALLDRLSIAKVLIVGHSMGGYVGQRFLRDYPDRISALVNVNSNPYADDPLKVNDREKEISFILNGKLVQLAQIAIPNMYCKANLRSCDNKVAETVEICETHDPEGVAAVVRGLMTRDDNVALLSATGLPVMFIYGDADVYSPLSRIKQIQADLPNCRHEIIHGTGHNTHVENPRAVYELVSSLL